MKASPVRRIQAPFKNKILNEEKKSRLLAFKYANSIWYLTISGRKLRKFKITCKLYIFVSASQVESLVLKNVKERPLDSENTSPSYRYWMQFIHELKKETTIPTRQTLTIFQIHDNQDVHYYKKGFFSVTTNKRKPIRSWKVAKHGTTDKYAGKLVKSIPELSRITEDQLDRVYDQFGRRE